MNHAPTHNFITTATLAESYALHLDKGIPMLQALQEVSGFPDEILIAASGARFGYSVPEDNCLALYTVDYTVASKQDYLRYGVVFARDEIGLHRIFMTDPFDGDAQRWALMRGMHMTAVPEISLICKSAFAKLLARSSEPAMHCGSSHCAASAPKSPPHTTLRPSIERFLALVLIDCTSNHAQAIHFEMADAELRIRLRVQDNLQPWAESPTRRIRGALGAHLMYLLKKRAGISTKHSEAPQEGEISVYTGQHSVQYHLTVIPTFAGEDAVLTRLNSVTADAPIRLPVSLSGPSPWTAAVDQAPVISRSAQRPATFAAPQAFVGSAR